MSKEKVAEGEAEAFFIDLIHFYKSFILGSAGAVSMLTEIHKKYPSEYKLIRELKENPMDVGVLMDKLSSQQKELLLVMLFKSSDIGNRLNSLFDLSVDDAEKLSKDLKEFAEYVENGLKGLKELK